MAVKKNNFLSDDLDFCRLQVDTWKKYIIDNPYHLVEDRKEPQVNKKTGGIYYAVVQNKETIQKALRDTAKDITTMLENIKRLEISEDAKKKAARGEDEVPESMDDEDDK